MNVEWLVLADAAQISGGKLYLLGGGWDVLNSTTFPVNRRIGLAVSFLVPWNETNQKHDVEILMLTEDGEELAKINAQIEQGRPPGLPPGSDQRTQIAADINLQLKKPGVYSIVASIEGREDARTQFRVVGGQAGKSAGTV